MTKLIAVAGGFNSDVTGRQTFTDVPSSDPFYVSIEQNAIRGTIWGFDSNNQICTSRQQAPCYFGTNNPATRGQIAYALYVGSNGFMNGMFNHCCLDPNTYHGQYPGTNNMNYNNGNPNIVDVTIPGGFMFGNNDGYGSWGVTDSDIWWNPNEHDWLVAHEYDGGYNRVPAIAFHAYNSWGNGTQCTNGAWSSGSIVTNIPNFGSTVKSACLMETNPDELRVFFTGDISSPSIFSANTRYFIQTIWYTSDQTGQKQITTSNYWLDQTLPRNSPGWRDDLNKFCYDVGSGDINWCP